MTRRGACVPHKSQSHQDITTIPLATLSLACTLVNFGQPGCHRTLVTHLCTRTAHLVLVLAVSIRCTQTGDAMWSLANTEPDLRRGTLAVATTAATQVRLHRTESCVA